MKQLFLIVISAFSLGSCFAQGAPVYDNSANLQMLKQTALSEATQTIQKLQTKIVNKTFGEASKTSAFMNSQLNLLTETYSASGQGSANLSSLPQAKDFYHEVNIVTKKIQVITGLMSKYSKYVSNDKMNEYSAQLLNALFHLQTAVKNSGTASNNDLKITMKERLDIISNCSTSLDKSDNVLDGITADLGKDKVKYDELYDQNQLSTNLFN